MDYVKKLISIKNPSNLNILYITDVNYIINKMSRVRFWAIEELSKRKDINLYINGLGMENYNPNISIQQNILNMHVNFDLVIWYKPLNKEFKFDFNIKLPFLTCLRYNEMWDEKWTRHEIDRTHTDIIICHHLNDYEKYTNIYKKSSKKFFYNPHHARNDIFKDFGNNRPIDILLSGVSKELHYPLKNRLFNLVINRNEFKKYNVHTHIHPQYNVRESYKNIAQIDYNKIINQSKICIACTSKYNYRLGKYIEIPMAGGVICGDLPYENKEEFGKFVIEVNMSMSDDAIVKKIINALESKQISKYAELGKKYVNQFTPKNYIDKFLNFLSHYRKSNQLPKIFIISDEINPNHIEFKGQKWICDTLKEEFLKEFPNITTRKAQEANIIWYLAPWNYQHIPINFCKEQWIEKLKKSKVIFTQHHIDEMKLDSLETQFDFMKTYSTKLHAICTKTLIDLKKYIPEKKNIMSAKHLWINENIFYEITNKKIIRQKYKLSSEGFFVGSFQKDTEGNQNKPKLSKGPDLFVNIVKDMFKTNNKITVILTGTRRHYIINELNKAKVPYVYFEMLSIEEINELYNCLDLYIVSSRCEGGPRSIIEAGLCRIPIISTNVGIADDFLSKESLFDKNNWITYKNAIPNPDYTQEKINSIKLKNYIREFKDYIID
jgi:hypothetical protein